MGFHFGCPRRWVMKAHYHYSLSLSPSCARRRRIPWDIPTAKVNANAINTIFPNPIETITTTSHLPTLRALYYVASYSQKWLCQPPIFEGNKEYVKEPEGSTEPSNHFTSKTSALTLSTFNLSNRFFVSISTIPMQPFVPGTLPSGCTPRFATPIHRNHAKPLPSRYE